LQYFQPLFTLLYQLLLIIIAF